ncbi:hypothetical protein HYH02_000511 [Chlamydomonas schloesseri]|uniref:Elongator complex protein 5 n=1 Tax=Chlamydomonas schloesseri TaxID=2026947 RepID=A0A836BCP0_9CHLO|nr:hypothetical protein HYH02_000511 [Chlamydomonas schloesseri]|eukprot:KAG2454672.1 hypothetical protein HYH02_000511 [Chlamydomonas schloesseri]
MRQGRSQATVVRLVDLTGTLAPVAAEAAASAPRSASAGGPDVEYVDLHSDPWGWHRGAAATAQPGQGAADQEAAAGPGPGSAAAAAAAAAAGAAAGAATAAGRGAGPLVSLDDLLDQLVRPASQSAQTPDAGRGGVCVVLGCLSSLVERYGGVGNGGSGCGGGGADGGGGGEWAALALVEALQRAPAVSCVLASVHTDLHSEAAVEGLRRAASCVLQLGALTDLQQRLAAAALQGSGRAQQLHGGALAGRLDCRTRRRTGRVKVESELYSISLQPAAPGAGGGAAAAAATAAPAVHFFAMPPQVDAPDPKALLRLQPPASAASSAAAPAAAPAGGGGGGAAAPGVAAGAAGAGGAGQPLGLMGGVGTAEELARAVGSSMRLTLTEEERRAKQAVVLPYQHTGTGLRGPAAAAYAAGDHAGYLPPAAGGRGPGAAGGAGAAGGGGEAAGAVGGPGARGGGLGHILYVRDSASEQDSDQDLDEDLDI